MLSTNKRELEEPIIVEQKEEIKEQINNATETTTATADNDEGEMELLTDLRKATDKDIDKSTKVEHNADGTVKVTTTTENKTTQLIYSNHELVANLTVSAISVTMCLVLQFISDNWSEEAEKKYLLTPQKKQQLLEPLTLVLAQSKSKYNPVVILVITVLVLYVPNFITAFRERNTKKKLAGKRKQINPDKVDEANEETENETLLDKAESKTGGKAETKIITKEIFKMTKAQNERLLKIKSKRGARSEADKEFIREMGLDKLI